MPTNAEVREVAGKILNVSAQLRVDQLLKIGEGGIELAVEYMTALIDHMYDEDEDMTEDWAKECYRLLKSLNTP